MFSRWLRWLVVAPVVLFVFGAIMLSCGGGGGYGGGGGSGPPPGFSLESMTISTGAPVSPTFTPTPKGSPTHTPKPATPTMTPRPPATTTCVATTAPSAAPSPLAFNVIGTFTKYARIQYQDITAGTGTFWTSTNNNVLQAPPSGPLGGLYTTGYAGCVCILASNSGVSSQQVGVGVGVDDCADNCPACPTALPTATPTPKGALEPAASGTPAPSARSAGILMWTFDPGAELRGRIATGDDGSIYFITRDGVLHGLNSAGKETMHRYADGLSPAVMPDGNVVAMSSRSELAAIGPDGAMLWNLEIGESAGPLAATDRAIYASAGADLVSVSTSGSLNWRMSVGPVTAAATTPDGVVVGTSRGAVTALASDGAVVWTFTPDGGFSGSVAYADEVVYAGSAGGGVYAIDLRTGNPIWHVNSAHAVTTGPAVASSGTIFAGSDTIYGVSADGQLRWKDPTLKPGDAGLFALGYDSVFDAATGDVGAVLMGDGSYVWTSRSFGKITTAASSPSGMLYVGTSTGRIFAIR
ncbi:MAG: PQQ-binding-like beta-propeller repeat protein [Candidatus Binatus sp.]